MSYINIVMYVIHNRYVNLKIKLVEDFLYFSYLVSVIVDAPYAPNDTCNQVCRSIRSVLEQMYPF